jgi:hypothetical protein
MRGFRFELATEGDDDELRRVLAATPMPGRIVLRTEREPSWFGAAVIDGHFRQVVACRNLDTGRIVGFGCRSVRRLFVNGHAADVGYLSGLRVLPEFRNLGLVARGYAFFRKLHEQDHRVPFYVTTIAQGNETALKILTSGRASLPTYHPAGAYHTLAVARSRRLARTPPQRNLTIRTATAADLATVVAWLAEVGKSRQFFPAYEQADFLSVERGLRGVGLDDIVLAQRDGQLVGMIAGWDQHAFRQNVIAGYQGWLHWLRPVYNGWQRLRGGAPLPSPGGPLRCLLAAMPVVSGDDPEVFRALIEALRRRLAAGPWSHMLVGLHERDPLLAVARPLAAAVYTTCLFLAAWPDGVHAIQGLGARPPYLELGAL